jgi:hypothetical protein
VLFAGEEAMQAALVEGVRGASEDPVLAGLDAVARELEPRREELRRRAALIASHPALRERELGKQAATAAALRLALTERGVEPRSAQVMAEVAIVLLRVAFERWLQEPGALDEHIRDALAQAQAVLS